MDKAKELLEAFKGEASARRAKFKLGDTVRVTRGMHARDQGHIMFYVSGSQYDMDMKPEYLISETPESVYTDFYKKDDNQEIGWISESEIS